MSCSDIRVQLLGDAADILVYVQQAQSAVSAAQQAEAAAQGSATQAAQSATAVSGSATQATQSATAALADEQLANRHALDAQAAATTASGAVLDAEAAANAALDTFNTSIQPYADEIESLEVNSITSLETTVDGSAKTVQLVFRSSAGIVFTQSLDLSVMFN